MKEFIFKKFQRSKLYFKDLHQKTIVRAWGLAKRLDQSHRRNEKKK